MGTTADFYKGLFGTRTRTTAAEPSPRRAVSVERARVGSRKWLVFVRCVVVAALVAVFANGVVALARRPDSRPVIRTATSAFPTDAARAYATRFVAAYLSWDVFSPDTRATALAAFLPAQLARAQVGWNGSGRQKVTAATPSTVEIVGPTEARVIVDVTLEPGGALCVQTAVRSGGNGSLAVVAYPSAVACPGIARQPRPTPPVLEQDASLSGVISAKVSGFLRAWISSSTDLAPYVTQDSGISGLGSFLQLDAGAAISTQVLAWDGTDPTRRQVITKTTLRTPGGGSVLQMHRVTVRQISGYWLVSAVTAGVDDPEIAAAPEEPTGPIRAPTPGTSTTPLPATPPSSPSPVPSAPTAPPTNPQLPG